MRAGIFDYRPFGQRGTSWAPPDIISIHSKGSRLILKNWEPSEAEASLKGSHLCKRMTGRTDQSLISPVVQSKALAENGHVDPSNQNQ